PDLRRARVQLHADTGHRARVAPVRARDGIPGRLPAGRARRAHEDRRRIARSMSSVPAGLAPRKSVASGAAVLFAIAAIIWGSTWLAIKFQLGSVAAEASVTYRFALAALILALWCAVTRRSLRFPARVHAMLLAQGALMFGINYIAVYKAEEHIASGLVAVLFSSVVFMSLFGTRIAFGTPNTGRAMLGAMLGVGGVALLFLPQLAGSGAGRGVLVGIAYGLAAPLLSTGGNLVSMRMQREHLPIL